MILTDITISVESSKSRDNSGSTTDAKLQLGNRFRYIGVQESPRFQAAAGVTHSTFAETTRQRVQRQQ